MQALSVTTGLCAITVDSDTGTADASSTSRTPIAPNLSQPPYDRWTDLPDDVTVQVMYWLMLDAGTVPLALASGRFLQAGQVFRASPWYEGAKSVLMHQRCLDWTRSYLSGFANEPQLIFPKEVDELNTGLASLGKWPDDQRRSIVIDSEPITSVRGMDWLDGFRRYPGASLALTTGRRRQAEAAIIDIARALPPRVCLRLQCYPCTGGVTTPVDGIASLVSRIAQTGRAMAFDMEAGVDLSANAAELEAVLDIACGEGVISFINLGTITQPDILLRAMDDRCDRFRHLKLVMFNCATLPDRSALAALAAALDNRQRAGHSRLTVVIGNMAMWIDFGSGDPVYSAKDRAEFERCGLFFEYLHGERPGHPSVRKIIHSIGRGPADAWVPRVAPVADESSSDSDVIIESSDGDERPDHCGDEPQARPAQH